MTLEERDRAMRSLIVIENISKATQLWIERGFWPDDKALALIQKVEDNMIEVARKASEQLLNFCLTVGEINDGRRTR